MNSVVLYNSSETNALIDVFGLQAGLEPSFDKLRNLYERIQFAEFAFLANLNTERQGRETGPLTDRDRRLFSNFCRRHEVRRAVEAEFQRVPRVWSALNTDAIGHGSNSNVSEWNKYVVFLILNPRLTWDDYKISASNNQPMLTEMQQQLHFQTRLPMSDARSQEILRSEFSNALSPLYRPRLRAEPSPQVVYVFVPVAVSSSSHQLTIEEVPNEPVSQPQPISDQVEREAIAEPDEAAFGAQVMEYLRGNLTL